MTPTEPVTPPNPSSGSPASTAARAPLDTAAPDPRFREELSTMTWVLDQLRLGEKLPVIEATAIAHSVYVAMRLDGKPRITMLPLHDMREYGAVHAINVAMLAMSVAEYSGLDSESVRAVGLAGLLHDIGMVRVTFELLAKSDQLVPEERDLVRQHPAEGARIIVEADAALELAAVVAYEHHIHSDGTGYPALRFPRKCHPVSRLIQVCDTFHALRSPRPFRDAWPADIVFSFLQQRAGDEYDPGYVSALNAVIKKG